MGFVTSLTYKLSKSEISISGDSDKDKIKNELTELINAANEFMNKYGLQKKLSPRRQFPGNASVSRVLTIFGILYHAVVWSELSYKEYRSSNQ